MSVYTRASAAPMGFIHVAAAIIERDNRILVGQRSDSPIDIWEFPGGKLEHGETVDECIIREIREELNIVIEVLSYVDHFACSYDERRLFFSFCKARYVSGTIVPHDHRQLRWLKLSELKNLPMYDADRRITEKLLRSACTESFSSMHEQPK